MNTIPVELKTEQPHVYTGVYQHDYGQILQIHGKNLPAVAEVQFSLQDQGGQTETRVGVTTNDVLEVQVPDKMLKNEGVTENYRIFAYLYITDGKSGNTEYKITIHATSRPAPGEIAEDLDEPHPFDEAVNAVNAAAERAETAEAEARSAADNATAAAESARKSAEAVAQEKNTAISAIQNQQTASEKAITDHTDTEIGRLDRETQESEDRLTETIRTANDTKEAAENTISEARRVKESLDISVQNATKEKEAVEASTSTANAAKKNLDQSTADANVAKTALDKTIQSADDQNTSLGEKIETSKQLKTDLQTAGEKATQDIQTAGSEQLGKMQAVAEEFTADREQIATNKEDIGSLKEDLSNKITKFYASNQGETHLADSDNGKIMDMMLYGMSEQKQYSGKNLLKYPYIETTKTSQGITFTDNKDGSINVSGTATGTAYYNLYSNRDGKRLTLASGTYKLVTKGRSGCNVTVNNGVNSAKNEGIFTITEGHNEIYCYIAIQEGLTVDETIYPMIQLASSIDESYEPYTGGKPSPNPDYPQEIKRVVNPVVKVCGKNLWNPIQGGYISGINGSITAGTKTHIAATDFIKTSGKDITVIARNFSSAIKDNFAYRIGFYDARKKWIKNVILSNGNKYSINTFGVTGTEYIRVSAPSGIYDTIQIEKGSEATPYEPYTEQSVQLPYTLNAIPVTSGGNVTIDGQQYIADRVVEKDGVFGIERNIREIHTNTETMNNNSEEYPGWKEVEGISDVTYYSGRPVGTSRMLTHISNFTQTTLHQNNIGHYNIVFLISGVIGYSQSELIAKAIDVDMYIRLQDAIFEPLPGDIQAKLRTLVTNYPVTNISVNSEQLDGYTVFNYPISMQNGWNYVKQQLNDNRDYIYDMDIQSAEAYVNSEYAVALTELEV